MELAEIKEALKANLIVGEDKLGMKIDAGAGGDLMSDLLRRPMNGVVVLSGLNNLQVIRTAIIAGAPRNRPKALGLGGSGFSCPLFQKGFRSRRETIFGPGRFP
jgi:hypothetical protein